MEGSIAEAKTEQAAQEPPATTEPLTPETLEAQLQSAQGDALAQWLQRGYEAYVHHMRAFRARTAERFAAPLHRVAAAPWSATCLASSKRRGGDPAAAVEILREQIERTQEKPQRIALYEALSLALDAAGRPAQRLDALGHAYAEGGRDAQQILGYLALQEGRWEQAGFLFGDLVDDAREEGRAPEPWALPGWGLALLEGAHEEMAPPGSSQAGDAQDD